MLEMEDEEGIDHKFVGVPLPKVDPINGVWADISDIPEALKNRIKHFFETYKALKGKGDVVVVHGFKGRAEAITAINKSMGLYQKKFRA